MEGREGREEGGGLGVRGGKGLDGTGEVGLNLWRRFLLYTYPWWGGGGGGGG